MKWLVGPRRIGKTTTLIQNLLALKGKVILVSWSKTGTQNVHLPALQEICKQKSISWSYNDKTKIFKIPNLKIYLKSYEEVAQLNGRLQNVPLVIDEGQYILEQLLNAPILLISGSGANYKWDKKRANKHLKLAKKHNTELADFQLEWR